MQHENLVSADNCTQSVRDGDRRPPEHQFHERRLNLRLDLAVDRARGLVEHEQRRIGGDRARERQQLSLTDTDRRAALAELLRVSIRQSPNDAIRAHSRRRRGNVQLRHRIGQSDVRQHIAGEEEDVLLDISHERPKLVEWDFANIDAIDEDSPALRIIEPQQQVDDRRLARPRVPDQRQRPSRLDFKPHAPEHPLRRRRLAVVACNMAEIVREPHVLELHRDPAPAASRRTLDKLRLV